MSKISDKERKLRGEREASVLKIKRSDSQKVQIIKNPFGGNIDYLGYYENTLPDGYDQVLEITYRYGKKQIAYWKKYRVFNKGYEDGRLVIGITDESYKEKISLVDLFILMLISSKNDKAKDFYSIYTSGDTHIDNRELKVDSKTDKEPCDMTLCHKYNKYM